MTAFEVAWGAASHQGAVRDHNEDAWLASPNLFLVADGMGGHARGAAAARAVVDAFRVAGDQPLTSQRLQEALQRASRTVSALQSAGKAPGSTVVGVGLTQQAGPPCWLVFNVGDSRAYLLRTGQLEQISVDHSRAQELLDAGQRSAAEVNRNIITRAVGAGTEEIVADQWLVPAAAGDRILLCSDGLTSEISDPLIAAGLLAFTDPKAAADQLLHSALMAGGRDNITVLVIDAVAVANAELSDYEDTIEDLGMLVEANDTCLRREVS